MQLINIINQDYVSSSEVTEQYKTAKREFIKTLKQYFGKDAVIVKSCPHFEFTGFVMKNKKYVYFSTGDLRWNVCNSMLVRIAKNDTDWTGGRNQSISYAADDFDNSFVALVNHLLYN